MTRRTRPPAAEPSADAIARLPAPLPAPELTEAECRRCGTYIAGLDGRYACGVCGWVNDHSEGHRRLPTADEDPDRPAARGRSRRPRPLPPGPQEGPQESPPGPADPSPTGH
ncbi:hypothetical protein [Streptomyces sp. NBC_01006]|uniref:hypothetical protein n=1 Tax=Streptomyces sp. NBC_01006 TaxID=2903716 RepID=UPI003868E00D|nr:hypothetical protein OG509_11905 [Streptomyces sp. NBC_01006]